MTLKSAALLAFVGTLLATVFLTWMFILHLLLSLRGAEALAAVLSWFIYAFASLTLTVFFFVFHRSQS
jgi:hypothetical protein